MIIAEMRFHIKYSDRLMYADFTATLSVLDHEI